MSLAQRLAALSSAGSIGNTLEEAKALLRSNGYVVIKRERHVVLQSQRVVPPEYLVQCPEGFTEHAMHSMAAAIGRQALTDGLMYTKDTTALDPVTGRERFLHLSAAMIMPRQEHVFA